MKTNYISDPYSSPLYQATLIKVPTQTRGMQESLCIPYEKLNGWLFSINHNRVGANIKDKLIKYKEECFEVLHRYFEIKHQIKQKVPPTQLDLITPYEVRRDLTTTRRALTIEKNKHEKTAELYNKYRKIAQEHEQTIRQLEGKVMQLQDHEVIASTVYRALQDSLELQKIKKVIQIGA